ncbi:hypothetical protein GCM10023186_41340 [Hymenobacter koreensis]|uniref:Uncharacterized protein n=1 Tax=Hymenobacter koreensis TaxID=1084523 RepID=A0ABP8JJD7_9BACT
MIECIHPKTEFKSFAITQEHRIIKAPSGYAHMEEATSVFRLMLHWGFKWAGKVESITGTNLNNRLFFVDTSGHMWTPTDYKADEVNLFGLIKPGSEVVIYRIN